MVGIWSVLLTGTNYRKWPRWVYPPGLSVSWGYRENPAAERARAGPPNGLSSNSGVLS